MRRLSSLFFFFNDTATTEIYTLSLHDALPICRVRRPFHRAVAKGACGHRSHDQSLSDASAFGSAGAGARSEEHTSELQSPCNLVCRLLLEKKKQLEFYGVCASLFNTQGVCQCC